MSKKLFITLFISGILPYRVAFAGNVELRATRHVCKLEVREGADAINPTNNSIVYSGSVDDGWSYVSHEGTQLWWRRGGHWDDCVPAGWNNWKGAHNPTSGTDHATVD